MATEWSAGLQPALGVGKPPSRLQVGAPPGVCGFSGRRGRSREKGKRLPGFASCAACALPGMGQMALRMALPKARQEEKTSRPAHSNSRQQRKNSWQDHSNMRRGDSKTRRNLGYSRQELANPRSGLRNLRRGFSKLRQARPTGGRRIQIRGGSSPKGGSRSQIGGVDG